MPNVNVSHAAVFAVVEVALANVAFTVHTGAAVVPAPINIRFEFPPAVGA